MTDNKLIRRKAKPLRYAVKHEGTSGGPQFTCITEALAYVKHVLKSRGDKSVTIIALGELR